MKKWQQMVVHSLIVMLDAYRNRNVVERCFGCLKEYRRIATRYDKTARNYLAMVKLGCIRLFYKKLCN
ncbi:hypothetical protein SM87_03042 [Klebsiella pneumoniae]|nr:hypothetical protein SM87_03042 [Klebsiella pneumoniae]GJK46617.1 hypothetical protein TUM17559_47600 [Enterobacter cloacae]GJK89696.1 hypothetical protein TUM17568_09020 [Klebsiella oxytoca]GJL15812.1 hypothetical protein TUM17572_56190 [Klebsiella oxytoca]SBL85446.1 Transposase and inactivated derivatives [Klebsiella grimontii]